MKIVHPVEGRVPWKLYPYQEALVNNRSRFRLVVKAREIGVSQTIAGEAIHRAKFHSEREQVVISRNGPEAKKLIRYCRVLASTDPDIGALEGVTELKIPAYDSSLNPAIDPASGRQLTSRIEAEAASSSAGRGGGKIALYVDEFAHGNFRHWGTEIYQSVLPGIALGGMITFISTPKGKSNMFYRLYREALQHLNGFQIIRIRWDECPYYNPKGYLLEDPDDRLRIGMESDWYNLTRPGYDDASWAEEYGCDFTASAGLVYPEFDEQKNVGDFLYNPNWPSFAGQDFGFTNPSVALIIQVSPSEDVFVIHERYDTGRSVSDLSKNRYKKFLSEYKVRGWYCDPASPGDIADMKREGIPAKPARRHEVEDGVRDIRKLIKPPFADTKLHIDRSCVRLITDMTTFAYKHDSDKFEKDIADHGPDALRYFVRGYLRGRIVLHDIPVGGMYATAEAYAR